MFHMAIPVSYSFTPFANPYGACSNTSVVEYDLGSDCSDKAFQRAIAFVQPRIPRLLMLMPFMVLLEVCKAVRDPRLNLSHPPPPPPLERKIVRPRQGLKGTLSVGAQGTGRNVFWNYA